MYLCVIDTPTGEGGISVIVLAHDILPSAFIHGYMVLYSVNVSILSIMSAFLLTGCGYFMLNPSCFLLSL